MTCSQKPCHDTGGRKGAEDVMFSKTIMLIIALLIIVVCLILFTKVGDSMYETGCRLGTEFLKTLEEAFGLDVTESICG